MSWGNYDDWKLASPTDEEEEEKRRQEEFEYEELLGDESFEDSRFEKKEKDEE